MDDTQLRVELARLDERLKALAQDHGRAEAAASAALQVSASELARRLSELNHAHAQAVEKDAQYVSRESLAPDLRRIEDRIDSSAHERGEQLHAIDERLKLVEVAVHEFKARSSQSWLLWGVLVAMLGLMVGVAKLVFK